MRKRSLVEPHEKDVQRMHSCNDGPKRNEKGLVKLATNDIVCVHIGVLIPHFNRLEVYSGTEHSSTSFLFDFENSRPLLSFQ